LLPFQRIQVQFLTPTWQTTTDYNSSSKLSDTLTQAYMHAGKNTNAHKVKKKKKEIIKNEKPDMQIKINFFKKHNIPDSL
jgi:hypothetical protein